MCKGVKLIESANELNSFYKFIKNSNVIPLVVIDKTEKLKEASKKNKSSITTNKKIKKQIKIPVKKVVIKPKKK